MVLETFISHKLFDFPKDKMNDVKATILDLFQRIKFEEEDFKEIIKLLRFDKKNNYGNINFVLLNDIGNPELDCQVENDLIIEAFHFYKN